MSLELESAYESLLFRNELPATWRLLAFRSEANLREFLKDLDDRIRFFKVRILCSKKPLETECFPTISYCCCCGPWTLRFSNGLFHFSGI